MRIAWKPALKIALSVAFLAIAVSLVDYHRFGDVIRQIKAIWVLYALVAWIAYQATNALLVVVLLENRTTLAKVWRVNLISTYFGLFLPGDAVAGMASRIRYLGLPSWQDVAVLTLSERLLALGVASALACLIYWFSSFDRVLGPMPAFAAFAMLAACVAGLATMRSARLRELATRLLRRWKLRTTAIPLNVVSVRTTAIAAAVWLLSGLTAYFVLRAFDAKVTVVDAFLFSYIITLAQLLPFFFAGIGIRDVSAIAVLGAIGVGREIALGASLVGLMLLVASGLVGGLMQIHEERVRAS